jgi:acetylornithine deacetylase/succinyl-diaminopimelate desuccinylase-like protein
VGGLNVLESGAAPAQPGVIYGQGQVAATLDARLLPQHDPDAFLQTFAKAAQAWVERLGRGELSLQLEVTRNASGMALPDDAPLVRSMGHALSRAGLDGAPRAKPTSTEAGVFARAGCEAIVFGPGRSTGNAHTANERIEITQLERAIDLYQSLLVELCEGEG